jgi:hypothetical protein
MKYIGKHGTKQHADVICTFLSTWLGRVRYNAVLAAIELFTTKQQRHLQAQEMQPIIVSNKFKQHHGIIFSVHSRAEQSRRGHALGIHNAVRQCISVHFSDSISF